MESERITELRSAQKKIGYDFKVVELLDTALTHASYANEHRTESYERLEFLGDSVLGMVVANHLLNKYPKYDEGKLTKFKASVVEGETLSEAVENLGLIGYVRHGKGKASGEVVQSDNVKEDIFESVVGAIMLDGGIAEAEKFILRELDFALKRDPERDFKSRFNEYAAKRGMRAEIVVENGEGGPLVAGFVARAYLDGELVGEGEGKSKKKAGQNAARAALNKIRKTV